MLGLDARWFGHKMYAVLYKCHKNDTIFIWNKNGSLRYYIGLNKQALLYHSLLKGEGNHGENVTFNLFLNLCEIAFYRHFCDYLVETLIWDNRILKQH